MVAFVNVVMQLFGYNDSADAAVNLSTSSSVPGETDVFMTSAVSRVGAAAGDRHRCDVAVRIRRIDKLDCYVTVSRRGIVSTWSSSKVINHLPVIQQLLQHPAGRMP